jgi:hypothetical protein
VQLRIEYILEVRQDLQWWITERGIWRPWLGWSLMMVVVVLVAT